MHTLALYDVYIAVSVYLPLWTYICTPYHYDHLWKINTDEVTTNISLLMGTPPTTYKKQIAVPVSNLWLEFGWIYSITINLTSWVVFTSPLYIYLFMLENNLQWLVKPQPSARLFLDDGKLYFQPSARCAYRLILLLPVTVKCWNATNATNATDTTITYLHWLILHYILFSPCVFLFILALLVVTLV